MTEAYNKPATTFHQQIQKLKDRGLVIDDDADAVRQLSGINYYRLSAYWYPFREKDENGTIKDNFFEDANFRDVIQLYEFDRKLRLHLIDALERIEVAVRTQVSYVLAHNYGAFAHAESSNFHPKFNHSDWTDIIEEEATRSSEEFIKHYQRKYDGFPTLPIWMVTEIMSFGSLSKLYRGMTNQDKKQVANKFQLHHKQMSDWLHALTYVRNICTHHGRVWNRELAIKPGLPRERAWQPPLTPTNNRMFFVLLMIRHMLKQFGEGDNWAQDVTELIRPIAENDNWRKAMGMTNHWDTHILWR